MKFTLVTISALVCLGSSGCVAGPGGTYNAANRTITGAALGAAIGGLAGRAVGMDVMGGAAAGAIAGGALGAAVNPRAFDGRDTRGYCYTVDAQGQPIAIPADSAECKAVQAGTPVPAQ